MKEYLFIAAVNITVNYAFGSCNYEVFIGPFYDAMNNEFRSVTFPGQIAFFKFRLQINPEYIVK